MTVRACTFRQRDMTRAIRAARAAGVEIARIEIDPNGRIVIVADNCEQDEPREMNEWDRV